jgi:hypothetical protein
MSADSFDVNIVVLVCTDIVCPGKNVVEDRGTSLLGDSPPKVCAMCTAFSKLATLGG